MLRFPDKVRPGDTVYIVSPSGPVVEENLAHAIEVLGDWGLEVVLDQDIYARAEPGYFAGDDSVRAAAINRALRSDASFVLFSRGGYGLTRIVEQIDWEALARRPKWVVGFSDVTVFHMAARSTGATGMVHGPVAKSFALHSSDLGALRRLLFEHGLPEPIELKPCGEAVDASDWAPIVGGNASLVAAMLDSPHTPDFHGAILFLEDVGEADYRVDRLLTSISTSRRARGLQAVVLGDFTECSGVYVDEDGFDRFLARLGTEMSHRLGCPVYRGLPSGHGDRNVPIPVGHRCRIEASHLAFEPVE